MSHGSFEFFSQRACIPDLFQADQIRAQVQHHRRLHRAAVQSMTPLRERQPRGLWWRKLEVADFHDQQSMISAKPQPDAIQHLAIATMAVAEDEPPDSARRKGNAILINDPTQSLRVQAQGTRETHVLLAGPDRQRGKHPRGKVIRELTEGAGEKTHADLEVRGQRKMGTMLLDGGERHDDDRIAVDRARHIARGHGLPVPNGFAAGM